MIAGADELRIDQKKSSVLQSDEITFAVPTIFWSGSNPQWFLDPRCNILRCFRLRNSGRCREASRHDQNGDQRTAILNTHGVDLYQRISVGDRLEFGEVEHERLSNSYDIDIFQQQVAILIIDHLL